MNFKRFAAIILSILMIVESLPAAPMIPVSPASAMAVSIPGTLGTISDTFSPHATAGQKPNVILIQNLHVNRSVQFAISRILKQLKAQNLLPTRIAVEGATGPMDMASMQAYPDAKVRKAASDYLVEQGEMPGAMHFLVTEGQGGLYGVETDEIYKANLEVYRRSYEPRLRLKTELEKISDALPDLRKNPSLKEKADVLANDIERVNQLINVQTTPDEMAATLNRMLDSVEHLKQVLPPDVGASMLDTLSAGAHFYAFALMRNEDLFKNTMILRDMDHQQTTVLITGGFHTQALAEQFKAKGLSYAIITPNVNRLDKVDEKLYVERLLDHHLTPEQVAQGLDWASMDQLEVIYRTADLFGSAIAAVTIPVRRKIAIALIAALVPFSPLLPGQQIQQLPPAPPLRNLVDWSKFIGEQRPRTASGELGLPLTFREAAGDRMGDTDAEMIVRQAAQAYDTSLAVIGLDDAGRHAEAEDILVKLVTGDISAMAVHAEPTGANRGAFGPHHESANFLFNMTPASGANLWRADGKGWKFWKANAGPSAWVAIAIAHHFESKGGPKNPTLLRALRIIGDGMILLQDAQTQGGVRYGAHHQPGEQDFNEDFDRINSENEVSAHAALRKIAAATGDAKYTAAADKILFWLTQADIYNPHTGKMQKGMMDPETGLLYVDAGYRNNRWEIQPRHATDSGGTWTISSLSPAFIDKTWGAQESYRMWQSIRWGMGWTSDYRRVGPNDTIAGVDFTSTDESGQPIPSADALISPEWTGGAVRAVEHLIEYYENGVGKGQLSADQIGGLKKDVASMRAWLDANPNNYAYGPGMTSKRQGRTYWGWFSGHGTAMAAIYIRFKQDPLFPAKGVTLISAPPARPQQAASPAVESEVPAPQQAPAPAPVAEAQRAAFSVQLTEQYGGPDYWGNWHSISPAQSQQIRSAESLEYEITPPASANFKAFHIDIKGGANLTIYGLFANKQGNRWVLTGEEGQATKAVLRVEGTKIIVTIPVSEIEASIRKAHAPRIENVQIQTGVQQDGHPLNDSIIRTITIVRPLMKSRASLMIQQGLEGLLFMISDHGAALFKGIIGTSLALAVVLGSQGTSHAAPLKVAIAQTAVSSISSAQTVSTMPSFLPFLILAVAVSAVGTVLLMDHARRQTTTITPDDGATAVEATVDGIPDSQDISGWRQSFGWLPAAAVVAAILTIVSCSKPTPSERVEAPVTNVENLGQSTIAPTTLYEHYEGADYQGYYTNISPAVSSRILNSKYIRYTFRPSDVDAFKGFHIQIEDKNKQQFYGLYGHKVNGVWKLEDENGSPMSGVKAIQVEGVVYVVIPVSQVKSAMQKGSADGIGLFHGQTGAQQNQVPLNDHNIRTGVVVEAFGGDIAESSRDGVSFIPVQAQTEERRIYDQVLYDHYEGDTWQGYFTKVSKSQSNRILGAKALEYVIHPKDYDHFKGIHIDVKDPSELSILSLFAIKRNGKWRFENEGDDNENKNTKATIREEDGALVIQIPMTEIKQAMVKEKATDIGQFHGQTGEQQDGKSLNDKNILAGIEVRTIGGTLANQVELLIGPKLAILIKSAAAIAAVFIGINMTSSSGISAPLVPAFLQLQPLKATQLGGTWAMSPTEIGVAIGLVVAGLLFLWISFQAFRTRKSRWVRSTAEHYFVIALGLLSLSASAWITFKGPPAHLNITSSAEEVSSVQSTVGIDQPLMLATQYKDVQGNIATIQGPFDFGYLDKLHVIFDDVPSQGGIIVNLDVLNGGYYKAYQLQPGGIPGNHEIDLDPKSFQLRRVDRIQFIFNGKVIPIRVLMALPLKGTSLFVPGGHPPLPLEDAPGSSSENPALKGAKGVLSTHYTQTSNGMGTIQGPWNFEGVETLHLVFGETSYHGSVVINFDVWDGSIYNTYQFQPGRLSALHEINLDLQSSGHKLGRVDRIQFMFDSSHVVPLVKMEVPDTTTGVQTKIDGVTWEALPHFVSMSENAAGIQFEADRENVILSGYKFIRFAGPKALVGTKIRLGVRPAKGSFPAQPVFSKSKFTVGDDGTVIFALRASDFGMKEEDLHNVNIIALSIEASEQTAAFKQPGVRNDLYNLVMLQGTKQGKDKSASLSSTTEIKDEMIRLTHQYLYNNVPQSQTDTREDIQSREIGMQQATAQIRALLQGRNSRAAYRHVINDKTVDERVKKALREIAGPKFSVVRNSILLNSAMGLLAAVLGFSALNALSSSASAATVGTVQQNPSPTPHGIALQLAATVALGVVGLIVTNGRHRTIINSLKGVLSQADFSGKVANLAGNIRGIFAPPAFLTEIPLSLSTRHRLENQEKQMGIMAVMGAA